MRNSKLGQLSIFLTLVVTAALLSGCGNVAQVPDSDRDVSGKYDGLWVARFKRTPSKQLLPGNWTFTCANREGSTIGFSIVKGVVSSRFASDNPTTANINKSGRFRLEVASEQVAQASGISDGSINNGAVTWILQGDLGKGSPSGYFVTGIAEFGNAGCTTKLEIERASGTEQST